MCVLGPVAVLWIAWRLRSADPGQPIQLDGGFIARTRHRVTVREPRCRNARVDSGKPRAVCLTARRFLAAALECHSMVTTASRRACSGHPVFQIKRPGLESVRTTWRRHKVMQACATALAE